MQNLARYYRLYFSYIHTLVASMFIIAKYKLLI
jgi:hypothetical protein